MPLDNYVWKKYTNCLCPYTSYHLGSNVNLLTTQLPVKHKWPTELNVTAASCRDKQLLEESLKYQDNMLCLHLVHQITINALKMKNITNRLNLIKTHSQVCFD